MAEKTDKPEKKVKKQFFIRTGVVIPFVIFLIVISAYFKLFFDGHLRRALEFGGYHAMGAQVDIASLSTSFFGGSIRIQGIQLTNPDRPTHNSLVIGDVRFGVLWDGLLRAKLVIEEIAVEAIQINVPRRTPGKVKPIKPSAGDSGGFKEALLEVKDQALQKTEKQAGDTFLGDVLKLLQGSSAEDQLQALRKNLGTEKAAQELESFIKDRVEFWEQTIKGLPGQEYLKEVEARFGRIKTSGWANPQEFIDSINQAQSLVREVDEQIKGVQEKGQNFQGDLRKLQREVSGLENQFRQDLASLRGRLALPGLDPKRIAEEMFRGYLNPILAKVYRHQDTLMSYMPPNLKKKNSDEPDESFQPRPRARGTVYEFGRPKGYPLAWIKKVSISSKASKDLGTGDLAGQITHITTNQILTGQPTRIDFNGDFPGQQIQGVKFAASLDNRGLKPLIDARFQVRQFQSPERPVLLSDEVELRLLETPASLQVQTSLQGFKEFSVVVESALNQNTFQVQAKDATVNEILGSIFARLPPPNMKAEVQGELPRFQVGFFSNVGDEFLKSLSQEFRERLEAARRKLEGELQAEFNKLKAQLDGEVQKFRRQFESEFQKVQAQINQEKAKLENQIRGVERNNPANQPVKALEEVLKQEGGQGVQDLRKRLGL